MTALKKYIVTILLLAAAACTERPPSDTEIVAEATQLMKANKIIEAEALLQNSIVKSSSVHLKRVLIQLYSDTEQWKKLQDFLALNSNELGWLDKYEGYGKLARNAFSNKNWQSATEYFIRSAKELRNYDGANQKICPIEAPELLRNAAAAAFNNNKISGIQEAQNELISIKNDPLCNDIKYQTEINKQLQDIQKMGFTKILNP